MGLYPARIPQPVIYLVEPFGGSMRRHNLNLPHVFWDDAAVTRGDGVFETILVSAGEPVNVGKHLERFARSAALLDLPEPDADTWVRATREAVADFVRESGLDPQNPADADALSQLEGKCVWTYTRGRESTGVPTAWVTVRPVAPEVVAQRENGVRVLTAPKGYTIARIDDAAAAPWMAVGAKSLNYAGAMAAQRWAASQGADDVIYIEPESGRVLESTIASVLVVKANKKLRTPVTGGDVLPGTTVAAIFARAVDDGWRCKEKDLTVDDLHNAEQVWLVSSVRGGVRVTSIDGKKLPTPKAKEEDAVRVLIENSRRAG
ncbi:aminodeoxychorismate lyase [Corynebacterium aquatimens]|uniref:4-amino-4-deoxychorismate lyase n=1 Tax=Corynebacterium aquatimens TaxID=1190508 RepID=A0A931E2C2_9CORY|nr:aminodeoxychorismate lyase [Corynebacterium aquatimens]MBG6122290.1 4-amino-4-deoxychorismate lyase [Corynebacterium aquatimens]WJY65169.1 D-alanine aminotransferase [Corynebacterium aquatimens]